MLSVEQQRVVDTIRRGENLFFTGSGGTGKTYVLRHVIRELPKKTTFVTAMTGIAALLLPDATTLHSFAGIGLGRGTKEELAARVTAKGGRNIKLCRVLIVDEVSMLDAELFDKLEYIARVNKQNESLFGGIQIILTGDFCQIPPVCRRTCGMLFESLKFQSISTTIELHEIFRQRDMRLITLLQEIRTNTLTEESIALLKWLNRPLDITDGILPTRLFCKNVDVDAGNRAELAKLDSREVVFPALDLSTVDMSRHCMAVERLVLKRGAQVMLLTNLDDDLKNGSRGVVVRFEIKRIFCEVTKVVTEEYIIPVVKFTNGDEVEIDKHVFKLEDAKGNCLASREQIPLKLAWCITVHKSQGQSIDKVEIKIDDAFDYGIAYVALSRATCIEGLRVVAFKAKTFAVDPEVAAFYRRLNLKEPLVAISEPPTYNDSMSAI